MGLKGERGEEGMEKGKEGGKERKKVSFDSNGSTLSYPP